MGGARLSGRVLDEVLCVMSARERAVVRELRRVVLKAAPEASEAVKFGVLSYFHEGGWLGSIGGNICMIEVKKGHVLLSFIRGAMVPDPRGLLFGKGKFKRFVRVPDVEFARSAAVAELVRASAAAPVDE